MPRQNRVQPDGEIQAHPARGAFMGNRGILHDACAHHHGQLTHQRWRHKAWVCCVLAFKNRQRRLMTPNRYTELFFHDEAVALAAGHRPCAECRRADHKAFLAAAEHSGPVAQFDAKLHAARAIPRRFAQHRPMFDCATLPNGCFVLRDNTPLLLWHDAALPFSPTGYAAPQRRPSGTVATLTPVPTVTALRNGYRPAVRLP